MEIIIILSIHYLPQNVCSAGSADSYSTRKDYRNLQKKEDGCLSTSIVMESYNVFCETLAHLYQLEEFHLSVDKELPLFKKHTDSFLASLTSSAEKLKESQSPFWKMPLPV